LLDIFYPPNFRCFDKNGVFQQPRDVTSLRVSVRFRRDFERHSDISTVTESARYDYLMSSLLVWFLISIVLLLSLGFVKMLVLNTYDLKLWTATHRARREIRKIARQRVPNADVFSRQGATAVSAGHLSFGIRVETDRQRTVLCEDPEIHKLFRDALVKARYPTTNVPVVHFGIRSQETVDRDYGGSWDEAGQMP
jgi:hypothetical protein